MDGRTDEWMDGWMDGGVDGWRDGWMDKWINGWMDRGMDVLINGWMDGWTNAAWQGLHAEELSGPESLLLASEEAEVCIA